MRSSVLLKRAVLSASSLRLNRGFDRNALKTCNARSTAATGLVSLVLMRSERPGESVAAEVRPVLLVPDLLRARALPTIFSPPLIQLCVLNIALRFVWRRELYQKYRLHKNRTTFFF